MSDLIDRAEAARRFPTNTCAASRHAEQIGVALVRDEPYPMLDEEPAYCGESILSVVASLWEARTEIERLRAVAQHEADCAEAYRAQVETMIRERDELRKQIDECSQMLARQARTIRELSAGPRG